MGADFNEGEKFRNIKGNVRSLRGLLASIGAFLTSKSQQAFTMQERVPGQKWKERRVPNVAAMLRDFDRGASIPARRFQPRPALIDTGALKNSISYRVIGNRAVEIGSNLPYSGIHQKGGEQTIAITSRMKSGMARFLKTSRGSKYGGIFGPLFRKSSIIIKVPKREFLAFTKQDARQLTSILNVKVQAKQT